jgi:hypothetical protein
VGRRKDLPEPGRRTVVVVVAVDMWVERSSLHISTAFRSNLKKPQDLPD